MKNATRYFIFLIFLTSTSLAFSQTNYEMRKILATYAHPTSDILAMDHSYYNGYETVTIKYESAWNSNAYYTIFKLEYTHGFISDIIVTRDDAFMPAFSAVSIAKDFVADALREESDEHIDQSHSLVSYYVDKTIDEFDGADITMLVLNAKLLGN